LTTVEEMRGFPVPSRFRSNAARLQPVEFTRYQLRAMLLGYKHEKDDDYHLVLASLQDQSLTMIAEIPRGRCSSKDIASTVDQERHWLIQKFGRIRQMGKMRWLETPVQVEVQGIGFFDTLHKQTGVSPNGVEIHPVLAISEVQ
jgi:hypothetical protein